MKFIEPKKKKKITQVYRVYTTWDRKQSNTEITNIYPITNQK